MTCKVQYKNQKQTCMFLGSNKEDPITNVQSKTVSLETKFSERTMHVLKSSWKVSCKFQEDIQ